MAEAAERSNGAAADEMREPMDAETEEAAGRPVGAAEPDQEPDAGPGGHVCNVAFCPIGLALTAADRIQPDVVGHLLVAGREFFLAAKAVIDARADDLEGGASGDGPSRMEHIKIG